MKLILLTIGGSKEPWLELAVQLFQKKIGHFVDFEHVHLKAEKLGRDEEALKKKKDCEKIINWLKPSDIAIGFSEQGRSFKNSIEFSQAVFQFLHPSSRLVLIVGGPYGLTSDLQARCKQLWSLSRLTMSHHVAQVVVLEQIYRALMIEKGRAYHNE